MRNETYFIMRDFIDATAVCGPAARKTIDAARVALETVAYDRTTADLSDAQAVLTSTIARLVRMMSRVEGNKMSKQAEYGAISVTRFHAGAKAKRAYGSSTATVFFVSGPGKAGYVEAYGPTPGDRRRVAIERARSATSEELAATTELRALKAYPV